MHFDQVIDTNDLLFDQDVLNSTTPIVLVQFWAPSCSTSLRIAPFIHHIAAVFNRRIQVVCLDVCTNQAVPLRYEVGVLPTFLIFSEGRLVDRVATVNPIVLERHLLAALESLASPAAIER